MAMTSEELNARIHALPIETMPRAQVRKLVTDLVKSHLGLLSVETRARLIDRLRRGWTRRRDEQVITDLLLRTRGEQLRELKWRLEGRGSSKDLVDLVFGDIDSSRLRARVLRHFREHALPTTEVKVVSDVDDTFYANWRDRRYPAKTVYPGVVEFFQELDAPRPKELPGDLIFLTGRPGGSWLENNYHRSLRRRGAPASAMLTGTPVHQFVPAWILSAKWANYARLRAVYPEHRFVLVGDAGQADADFFARTRERDREGVALTVIHDVLESPLTKREHYARLGVHFFDTYAGAALLAFQAGLLTENAVRRVAAACLRGHEELRYLGPEQRARRLDQVRADLVAIDARLVG